MLRRGRIGWRRVFAGAARRLADRRGVAALEFAMIAPLLILLYFGLSELSSAILAARHTNQATSSLGDITAQCSNVNDTDLTNMFGAASDIMAPLPITPFQTRVTSIQQMTNSPSSTQVVWSKTPTGQTGLTQYAALTPITLPAGLTNNMNDTVIMSEAVYNFTFPVDLFSGLIHFNDVTYFKPRKSVQVNYTGPITSGGNGTNINCASS